MPAAVSLRKGTHDVRGLRVSHELCAQLRVRGVDGDVYRAYLEGADVPISRSESFVSVI